MSAWIYAEGLIRIYRNNLDIPLPNFGNCSRGDGSCENFKQLTPLLKGVAPIPVCGEGSLIYKIYTDANNYIDVNKYNSGKGDVVFVDWYGGLRWYEFPEDADEIVGWIESTFNKNIICNGLSMVSGMFKIMDGNDDRLFYIMNYDALTDKWNIIKNEI